jgi:cysteine desulfurase/selenocysteine lyase
MVMYAAGEAVADPCPPIAKAPDAGAPRVGRGALRKSHVEPVGRQQGAEAIRPFDQRDAVGEGVFNAEFQGFIRTLEAVEVEMENRDRPVLVGLEQGKGRAGDFFIATARHTDEGAGKAGFAGAEIADQGEHVTLAADAGQSCGKLSGGRFIGQVEIHGGVICLVHVGHFYPPGGRPASPVAVGKELPRPTLPPIFPHVPLRPGIAGKRPAMTIDIDRARAETPGCENVLHFNNAGAALMPSRVIDAVKGHIDLEAMIGGYEAAEQVGPEHNEVAALYDSIASLINCNSHEVAVVENATAAWCQAFYGLSATFKPGDRILTAEAVISSDYIACLQLAKKTGCVVEVVPSDETGQLSVAALENMIDDRVKLISLTHVPTNGGLVNPAAAVGRVARDAGIPYLLDACQAVGQMPMDVEAIGCDILTATGRKFLRGPRGTGFLYIRGDVMECFEPPFLDLHAARLMSADTYEVRPDARRFENWECNVAGLVGLDEAIRYALEWGLDDIHERVNYLADTLRGQLAATPGVTVCDLGAETCGIVTFTVDGRAPREICQRLTEQSINVIESTISSTRHDMERRNLDAVVRASVHYYNTETEIERFMDGLARAASG